MTTARLLFLGAIGLIYAFVLAPVLVVLLASVSPTAYLSFPPHGFTWRWFAEIALAGEFTAALLFSLKTAACATVLATVLGTWIALGLSRLRLPFRAALNGFFLAPVLLPELALGIALLQYFSATLPIRGAAAVILAHSVICTPFVLRAVLAADQAADRAVEDAAASLGAAPLRRLADIVLPRLRPALIGGAVMAFVISFDNVSLSMFLSGPGAITLPALLYNQAAESGLDTSLAAVSALMIVFVLVVTLIVERSIGLDVLFATARRRRPA